MGSTPNAVKKSLSKGWENISDTLNGIDSRPTSNGAPQNVNKITSDLELLNELLIRHQQILEVDLQFVNKDIIVHNQKLQKVLILGKLVKIDNSYGE